MEIVINGKVSDDPKSRVLVIEAVARSIAEQVGEDPADAVMMLLTAAAHITSQYAREGADPKQTLVTVIGDAVDAAEGFFALRVAG